MDYKLATVGAKWWIEQMKKRCLDICPSKIKISNFGLNIDVIDISLAEKFSRFEKMLADEIQNHLNLYHFISFGCAYYPNKLLTKIAEKAEISTDFFPVHAQMEIANNAIRVSTDNHELYSLNISYY